MTALASGPRAEDADRPLVDPDEITRYLDDRLPGDGVFEVERHRAGHSNETFFIRRSGHEWVLRRPPRGAFLPTAHDVLREYRVLTALADTPVRAPRPLLACQEDSVIGAPFYVMERVEGLVVRDRLPAFVDEGQDAERRRVGEELIDALAELHAVDWTDVGLEGWGRRTGYLERQLRRWTGQLQLTTRFTRPLPELLRVGEWLAEDLPPSLPTTIVHGDYKLDNVVLSPEPPVRILAVLDWEMSTLGDPLADLGYLLSFWREPGDPPDPVLIEQVQLTRIPGFSSRAELVERYRERTGRQVGDLTWYGVLAMWKLAILLEGSYARHLAGATDDPFFAELEDGVPALGRRALEMAGHA
jgi:aminoglycoside phosphotransferase (APT) family kinase protein